MQNRRRREDRAQRLARYREAVELRQHGRSLRAVAREMGVNVRTIRRWLRADGFPERKERPAQASKLDAYRAYLDARFQEGCTNAAQLWRELRERGFQEGTSIVRAYIGPWRSGSPDPVRRSKKSPSLRQTAWLLVLAETEMKKEEQVYVETLTERCPEVAKLRELAHAFRQILCEHNGSAFDAWLSSAEGSLLHRFVESLRTDLSAVRAAVELSWSNGQTEGQVNRLKLIKRQMYGRAGFDLLRARVLHAA